MPACQPRWPTYQVEARLEAKIADSRAQLIRWVVGVGILQSSLLSALLLKMIPA
jgi:hypothetical protein